MLPVSSSRAIGEVYVGWSDAKIRRFVDMLKARPLHGCLGLLRNHRRDPSSGSPPNAVLRQR